MQSPNMGGNGGIEGGNTDDYEEIDYKICGELGNLNSFVSSMNRGEE